MEIKLNISADFECVYLVNGRLVEGGEIIYGDEQVIYITVLPLDAILLPYTIKLVGGNVRSNNDLVSCYKLGENNYYLKHKRRYNYVYSVPTVEVQTPSDITEKYFFLLLEQKINSARELMTKELNESIDDSSLKSFFNGFKDIIAFDKEKHLYHLINENNIGVLYSFVLKNNLIDNIIEI